MHHRRFDPSHVGPSRTRTLLSALLAFLLLLGMAPFITDSSATAQADEPSTVSVAIHFKDASLETVDFAQYKAPVTKRSDQLLVAIAPDQGTITYADNLCFAVYTQFASFQHRQNAITSECAYDPESGIVTIPARYESELASMTIVFWLSPAHPAYELLIASQLDTSDAVVNINGETLQLASDIPTLQSRASQGAPGAPALFSTPFPGSKKTHYQLNPRTRLEEFDYDQVRKKAAYGFPASDLDDYAFGVLFGTQREFHSNVSTETNWNATVLDPSAASAHPLVEAYLADTIAARLGSQATYATSGKGLTYHDRCITRGGKFQDDEYDPMEAPAGKALAQGSCGSPDINNGAGTPQPQASGDNYIAYKGIYHGDYAQYDGWNLFFYKFDTKSGKTGDIFQDITGYLLIPPRPTGKAQLAKVSADSSISNANSNYTLANGVFAGFRDKKGAQHAGTLAQGREWPNADAALSWAKTHAELCFTTNAQGVSNIVEDVDPDEYFVVELFAPKGFRLSSEIVSFKVHAAESDNDISAVSFENVPQFGSIDLLKQSNNPALTNGNSAYSLNGAVYGIFTDAACLNRYRTFTTSPNDDGHGYARTDRMPIGTYWVRELSRPDKGYALDAGVYPVLVTDNIIARVNSRAVIDRAKLNPLGIVLAKKDAQSLESRAQGAASLGDAHFRIDYYGVEGGTAQSLADTTPRASWVVRTDDEGTFLLDRADQSFIHRDADGNEVALPYQVSGDGFYRLSDGRFALPLGTYVIQEVKAPEGYLLDDTVHVRHIKDADHNDEILETFYAEQGVDMITNRVARADLSFMKRADGASKLAGIPFKLTSKTTGEWHIVVTDKNGRASTASTLAHPHSLRTNGNDAQFTAEDGSFSMPLVLNTEALDAAAGTWFGLNAEGESVPVDNGVGALPYDTYELEELRCSANALFHLIRDEVVVDTADEGRIIDLGTLNNIGASRPAIKTTARDGESGTHEGVPAKEVTIIDTVSYEGLLPATAYRLRAVLMDRSTNEPLAIDGELVTVVRDFTTEGTSGAVDVELTVPGADLDGTSLVVFESLMCNDVEVALHADIDDEGQTVSYAYPDRPLPFTGGETLTRLLAQTGDRMAMPLCLAAVLAVGGAALMVGRLRKRR